MFRRSIVLLGDSRNHPGIAVEARVIDKHTKLAAWLGSHVIPHEREVRAWLRRILRNSGDINDLIQEAYCRLANVSDVARIQEPRAYFFRVVRNVALEQFRRARVVRIESVAEMEALGIADEAPTPERIATGRSELALVQDLIAGLPERCRKVVELRKIHGMPQREIAELLGISENTVEHEATKGLRLILKELTRCDGEAGRSEGGLRNDERKTEC